MRIRSEHIEAIQRAQEAEFCRLLCRELRKSAPSHTSGQSEATLSSLVFEAVRKAKRYQIVTGDGIRAFVKLAVLINPRFDEVPDVQRFLKLPDLGPDVKIKMLSQLAAREVQSGLE